MREKLGRLASLVLAAILCGTAAADRKPTDPLAPLAPFVGEWVVDGKWASGQPLHARAIYEWSEHHRVIRARTYVRNGDAEYLRYEAVLGWHPRKRTLFEVSFAYNGELSEYRIEPVGSDTLRIGWAPFDGNETPRVRQTIRLQGKDAFLWTVLLKDGDGWKPLIEATWRRKGT